MGKDAEPIGKRKNKRFQCLNTTIEFDTVGIIDFLKSEKPKIALVNMSIQGVQIVSAQPLKIGKCYNIKIVVPRFDPLKIKAKTIWCKPFTGKHHERYHRAGLKFIKVDPKAKEVLIKLQNNPKLREQQDKKTAATANNSPYKLR